MSTYVSEGELLRLERILADAGFTKTRSEYVSLNGYRAVWLSPWQTWVHVCQMSPARYEVWGGQ